MKFKKIENFPDYSVSDTGKVLSEKNGEIRFMKLHRSKGGYEVAHLHKNGKSYNKRVHRLVAEAFIPNPENKPYIDHINGVRDDNRVCNLRWCTVKENNNFPLAKKNKSEAHKGHIVKEETRRKIAKSKESLSEESRKRLSDAQKGKILICKYFNTYLKISVLG